MQDRWIVRYLLGCNVDPHLYLSHWPAGCENDHTHGETEKEESPASVRCMAVSDGTERVIQYSEIRRTW